MVQTLHDESDILLAMGNMNSGHFRKSQSRLMLTLLSPRGTLAGLAYYSASGTLLCYTKDINVRDA